jgi:hypothetical protein
MCDSPEESFEFLKEGLTTYHLGPQQTKRTGEANRPRNRQDATLNSWAAGAGPTACLPQATVED